MALTPMRERYQRPDWVRRTNAMAASAGGARAMVPIDASSLIDDARAATGLADFGTLGDGDWEGRLRALVEAIEGNDLHLVGRLMTRQELARGLRTRLLLAQRWADEPAIAEEQIDAPIVVTGPARSGTTILFELLGLDPGVRTPIATDVLHPVVPAGVSAADVRAMTEAEQELWADVQPEFAAMHELRSDLPVECITLCTPSFAGNHWPMLLADLGRWGPDLQADLAFHRAVLQTVQFADRQAGAAPRRWLLKTPGYLLMLDDLFAAYPDACIVQTHRDPAKTMPSTVSTVAMIQWLRTDHVDVDLFSALVGAVFVDGLATVARRRAAGELAQRFGDVRFADLMADPVAAMAGAYEGIGRELRDGHRQAIADYLGAKPRAKHGTHRYTAADWGFDVEDLRAQLATYLGQYQVPLEP